MRPSVRPRCDFSVGFPGGADSLGAAARAVVAAVAVCLPAAGCGRLSQHPVVVAAVEEVSVNRRAADLLGGPVTCSPAVTGKANETDGIASMQFEASGPKGRGTVVVEGKKLGDQWGVTLLEIRPAAGGEHLVLTADLEERTGTDTPKFDPSAAATATPAAPPPADIEIALPPGP